jgi:hypothetical protein
MRQKNANKLTPIICVTIFLSIVSLSGCVDNQNTGVEYQSKFFGTWTGTLEIPMFGGGNNSNITQIMFMENIVAATLSSEQGSFTMNYTYSVEGDMLVLEPNFDRRGGAPNGQSPDAQFPNGPRQWAGTQPPNGTWSPNDTWSPNGTGPPNNGQPPGGERPSMSISFIYSFNEENSILFLNGTQFIKVK